MERLKGTVVFWKRELGFIRPDIQGQDVFIHYSQIEPEIKSFKTLIQGDRVEFDLGSNAEGKPIAINLKILRG